MPKARDVNQAYSGVMTADFDVFARSCPSRSLLDLVADKWALLVVAALSDGRRRHGELLHRIDGISQRMLTATLRELEAHGLVVREVFAEVPPRVEYALTPLGATMAAPMKALGAWSLKHGDQVSDARGRFDARRALRTAS